MPCHLLGVGKEKKKQMPFQLSPLKHERGIALAMVIVMAVVFSIAAFTSLTVALSAFRRQTKGVSSSSELRARYAAEAGLVYAMERLWANPGYPQQCCAPPGGGTGCSGQTKTDTLQLDTDGVGGNDTTVTITVTNCGANRDHTLKANVTF